MKKGGGQKVDEKGGGQKVDEKGGRTCLIHE
jgi:hypothetical protein